MGGGRRALLYAVVLLAGAAVLALELAAPRLFAPWFGTSLPVWTNVLAVVLGALAAGYALGGRLAARGATLAAPGWILLAAGLLSAGAAWAGPALARALLPKEIDLEGLSAILGRGSFVSTLLVFGPPMVLLGTVGPLAVHLLAKDDDAGRAAGRVLAVSTVGSIVGTYLATYALIPGLGTRGTVACAGGTLAACGLALVAAAGTRRAAVAAAAATIAAISLGAAGSGGPFRPAEPGTGTVLAEMDTPYQFLQVREVADAGSGDGNGVARLLTMNEGVSTYHSVLRPGSVLTGGRYYDIYPALPILAGARAGRPLRVLILGYAAGTQARALRSFWGGAAALEIDGAEIDAGVLELGRRHFESPEGQPGVRVRAADARAFLDAAAGEGRRYDLILLDCYHREFYLPFHLATVEFFRKVRERLEPEGVLAFNAFAYRPDDPLLGALLGTVAEAFGTAWLCPIPYYPNFVVLASPRAADLPLLSFSEAARAAAAGGTPRDPAWAALAAHPEGRGVLSLAADGAGSAIPRRRAAGARVLTDDHAPVERLADLALEAQEAARRAVR